MPPSPNAEGIREMVTSYDAYRIKFMEFNQSRSKEMQTNKANLKLAWAEWAAAWVLRHPELERLWTSVYEPESDL